MDEIERRRASLSFSTWTPARESSESRHKIFSNFAGRIYCRLVDGVGQHLRLNLARPKAATDPLPVMLCIHGGGFRAGHRDGNNALCLKLAQRGFVAATASYRLAPKYPFPAAVYDVKVAVRWL